MLEADLPQDLRHRVANCGRGGEGEVDYAEGHAEAASCLLGDELAHARYLERGALDRLAEGLEVGAGNLLERVLDYARTRHANVHHDVAFRHAVERARHERVVVGRVAQHHKLRAADRVAFLRALSGGLHDLAHQAHGVHVDAGLGGSHVHARAHALRLGKRLRDGADEKLVGGRHALRDDGRIAAEKVDAEFARGIVERARYLHEVLGRAAAGGADNGDRRHRNALVDDWDAEVAGDVLASLHERTCVAHELLADGAACGGHIARCTVKKRYAHRNRSHVQILVLDHAVRLDHL